MFQHKIKSNEFYNTFNDNYAINFKKYSKRKKW